MSKDAKHEFDAILANLERSKERFEQVQSIEEGLVFEQQLQFIKTIIERQLTEAEQLQLWKETTSFTLQQIKKQVTTWKNSPNNENLEKAVRTVNRVLSTPSDLIFDVKTNNASVSPTLSNGTSESRVATSSELKVDNSNVRPGRVSPRESYNNEINDTAAIPEKEKKGTLLRILSRMQRSSTTTNNPPSSSSSSYSNSNTQTNFTTSEEQLPRVGSTGSSTSSTSSFASDGPESPTLTSSPSSNKTLLKSSSSTSSRQAERRQSMSISSSQGKSIRNQIESFNSKEVHTSKPSIEVKPSERGLTSVSGKTKALIDLFSKIDSPSEESRNSYNNSSSSHTGNNSPLLSHHHSPSPSITSSSESLPKSAFATISPTSSSQSVADFSGASDSEENSISTPFSVTRSDIDWTQLIANIKDEIDPKAKEQIEQLIKEKGLGNVAVSNEKKKQLLRIFGIGAFDDPSKKKKQDEKNKKRWIRSLQKGNMEKKARSGSLGLEEVEFLVDTAMNGAQSEKEGDLKKLACIAAVAAGWPVETVPGARKAVINGRLLEMILSYASEGELYVHNEISPTDVEIVKMIAQGASAKVYLAKWKGKEVALKLFDPEHISFSENEFRRELALLSMLENENFVPCFGASTKGQLFIVTELMANGGLNDFIREMKQFSDFHGTVKFAYDIASGMKFMHSLNLIHRDLKSLNILINKDLKCKIIDFGTSRVVDNDKYMTANLGTPAWIAPEVLSASKYSEKADVYSFGIVMWELITAQEPFSGMQTFAIPQAVLSGKRPPIPSDCNKDYREVMEKCWNADPDKRPSFEQLEKVFDEMLKNFDADGNYKRKDKK